MYDFIIKNGLIVDGTGKKPYKADIACVGDKICEIAENIDEGKAKAVYCAAGKIVAPGFIDPHVHEEYVCLVDGQYDYLIKQGVTTVVNGNCGHSVVPGPTENFLDYYYNNGLVSQKQRDKYKVTFPKWDDFAGYKKGVEERGTNLNMATLLGHGTIRWSVMGGAFNRKPTEEENKKIVEIIRHNMEQGAFGISFGLDYVPSRYADMDELVEVASIIKEYDAMTAAHLRHYIGILESTEEFIEVGRRSGSKIQISHLKPTCPEAFEAARKAIESGEVKALIDTIPRSTGHLTSKARLIQFIMALSDELFDKGPEGVKAALKTKEGREIVKKDAYIFAGDKSTKFIVMSDDPAIEYKSVLEIAQMRGGLDPDEVMLDLIADDNNYIFWLGGPSREDFPMTGHDMEIVNNPYVCVGSDEIKGDIEDPYDWYELQRRGAFPIFMNMYLEKGVLVEEIVRRNTSMVAKHFGLKNRGELVAGNFADIAVIDLNNYNFPSPNEVDYRKPLTTASGVSLVFVNGVLTLKDNETKRSYAGKVLTRQ